MPAAYCVTHYLFGVTVFDCYYIPFTSVESLKVFYVQAPLLVGSFYFFRRFSLRLFEKVLLEKLL